MTPVEIRGQLVDGLQLDLIGPRGGRGTPGEVLHRQQAYSRKMLESGHTGGHLGWANPSFVAQWLCPIMAAGGTNRSPAAGSGS